MFSKLKIYGNCDVNYVWAKNDTKSMETINSVIDEGIHSPSWDSKTVALATFKTDLSASDMSQENAIYSYIIYRQNLAENNRYKIAEIDGNITRIDDYNVGSNAEYKYFITPTYMINNAKIYGNPIITEPIDVDWRSISIAGLLPTETNNEFIVDGKNIWTFELNVEDISYKINNQKNVSVGIGRFPKVSSNNLNYLSGEISCLLGNLKCTSDESYYDDDMYKLEKWQKFVNNGQLKLFKDRKGHVIPCEIVDTPTYKSNSKTREMITTISFNFVQLMDAKDISVYSTEV